MGRDTLTGLPNRQSLESRLVPATQDAVREGTRLAVFYVGLDNFKPINEALGHETGDVVLCEAADRLRALAAGPGLLARVAGDEFALLLPGNPDKFQASQVAARILESISRPIVAMDRSLAVSCSVGTAFFPDDGALTRLLAHASAAMGAAKRLGGATYCFFEPSMDSDARDQIELLRDLRRAVDADELELYFQPKIAAADGRITGVEALLRWHHPVRGLISPAVFVPIAERFGLIGALGNWVLETSLKQAGAWRRHGLHLRVAVNLSLHQLRDPQLSRRIVEALQRHAVDPAWLTCEITESVAMEDTPATQRAFRRLRATGVRLSIDDFGTGYSSLAYLRRLSVHELKIDRSFVHDVHESAGSRAIVSAVVTLAHALGLKVVAEGVETLAQKRVLMDVGCDELQGYLFAKPVSPSTLIGWASPGAPRPLEFSASTLGEMVPGL